MLPQQFPQLCKNILQIQKQHQISRGIHALQITVFAVVKAVHDAGRIVEVLIPEALAHRRPGIDELSVLLRENQLLALVLQVHVLLPPVEHILIVPDGNQLCLREMSSDLLCVLAPDEGLLYVNMGEAGQQRRFRLRTGIAFGMHPVPPFPAFGSGRAVCRFHTGQSPQTARAARPG